MDLDIVFVTKSILLGVGLAMDAFSVSVANGLNEPDMKKKKLCAVAGMFAFFQALMPMAGWFCVRTIVQYFRIFEKFIPWIALILLAFIGGKMLIEGIRGQEAQGSAALCFGALFVQGIATSIDALSVGFTIADYNMAMALCCALLIAAVTFVICVNGVLIGKKVGTRYSGKASILGGIILIAIGIEIFISGILG